MTSRAKLFLSIAIVAIIMLVGHIAASAQCPLGWAQKSKTISWGGCLIDVTYCVSPTSPVEIRIIQVRNALPTPCGDGSLLALLNMAEKGIIGAELGDEAGPCTKPVIPVTYIASRGLCYNNAGGAGYVICGNGLCTTTYEVVCDPDTFNLIFTVIAGPTVTGSCGVGCTDVLPCN